MKKNRILALLLCMAFILSTIAVPMPSMAEDAQSDEITEIGEMESNDEVSQKEASSMEDNSIDETEESVEQAEDSSAEELEESDTEASKGEEEISEALADEGNLEKEEITEEAIIDEQKVPEPKKAIVSKKEKKSKKLNADPVFDPKAAYEYVMSLDDDAERGQYLATLTEEEYGLLVEYSREVSAANAPVIETKVFTEAGPFMPAVKVPRKAKFMAAGAPDPYDPDGNGLSMSKTVTKNSDGTFKVRLEAWSTGEVRTETVTTPVDIVIVIDQSESMGNDFAGNDHITVGNWPFSREEPIPEAQTRQYAMKNAVKSFIAQVADKYDAADSDHRISVVTFGDTASTLIGWTNIDAAGKTAVTNAVNGLPTYPTATVSNTGTGMVQAESLISGTGYSYNGTNATRNKVVIVFTDGIPGASSLDATQANTALSSAYSMKSAGVTMYSVGIFNGANPEQLYGEKWSYQIFDDILCSGEVGSYWGGSWLASLAGRIDFDNLDIPSGNRFLNYLSSNFMSATSIGITKGSYDPGNHTTNRVNAFGTGYRIDQNFSRNTSGYYLTANDSNSLSNIFEAINTNIENPKIELGTSTEIREALSQYFAVSDGISGVSVKTAPYNGTSFSTTETSLTGASVSISDGVLKVSGFDYTGNFVSDTQKTDGTYGKKLIVEFNVTPDSNLLGGNDIPIDLDTSGIYAPKDNVDTLVESIPVTKGNVDIKSFEAVDGDIHVYCGNSLSDSDITGEVTTTNVNLDDSKWIKTFVDTEKTVTSQGSGYKVDIAVSPKTNGTNSVGTAATSKTDDAMVTVYKYDPEVIFKDSDIYLGETVPSSYGSHIYGDVKWFCAENGTNGAYSSDTGVTMHGDAPTLSYTYMTSKTGTVDSTADIGVNVEVTGSNSYNYTSNSDVVLKHQDCTGMTDNLGTYAFLLHVKACSLKITKTGWNSIDAGQSFIFDVDGPKDNQVVINGNGSVIIKGLPVGTYTVSENADWSWRYVPNQTSGNVTLSSSNANGGITFTNTRSKTYWLSGDGYKSNKFTGPPPASMPSPPFMQLPGGAL